MTWNDNRHRIAIIRHANGAETLRTTDSASNIRVSSCFSEWNRQQRTPASQLEVSASKVEWESKLSAPTAEIFVKLSNVGA